MGQDPSGFKYSKAIKFATYIVMEVKAAAVENTGRIFETERLIWVYSVGVLLMSLLRIKSTFMQKQFLTLSVSFTLDKAKQCSEYLLLLLWKEKKAPTLKLRIHSCVLWNTTWVQPPAAIRKDISFGFFHYWHFCHISSKGAQCLCSPVLLL